jgi:hypothetical protein
MVKCRKNVYKFIGDKSAVPFLLRGLIKFTPPAELNDPSELAPNVIHDEVVKSRERIRKNGYTAEDLVNLRRQENLFRLAPQFQAVKVPETPEQATALIRSRFYDQISLLEQRLSDMLEGVSSEVGLFCLSLRYNSLPMWAHYARNAAGLVVEFVGLHEVFKGDDTGVLSQPSRVTYDRDRRSVTFDTRSHESLFFAKFRDWRYEKEVRVVLPLADCRREKVGERHLHIREIPRECISRLILGWNMSKEDRQDIQLHVQELNPEVEVVDARIVHGRVELAG